MQLLVLTSCGFIETGMIGSDGPAAPKPPVHLVVPISPVYLTSSDSYLSAQGSCKGYQVIEFTYYSELTSSTTMVGKCNNDRISLRLPISYGDRAQVFSVKIVGYLNTPSATAPLPPNVTVNYVPPKRFLIGQGITSGGKSVITGGSISIYNSAVGQTTVGRQSSGSATSRSGF